MVCVIRNICYYISSFPTRVSLKLGTVFVLGYKGTIAIQWRHFVLTLESLLMSFFRIMGIIALVSLSVTGCQRHTNYDLGKGSIAVSVKWPTSDGHRPSEIIGLQPSSASQDTTLTTMRATVSADDIPEDIVGEYPFDSHAGSLADIPVGTERTLVLEALDSGRNSVYMGAVTGWR